MTSIGSNMSNLLTVDSLVRTYIHERGMVWHDYLRVLALALSAVRDLSKDINIGSNYKAKEITVDDSNSFYLPSDCVSEVKVCIESGDKIKTIAEVDDLYPIQKFENGIPVKRSTKGNSIFQDINYFLQNDLGIIDMHFGIPVSQPYGYQVFGNRVQLDSRVEVDCVLLIYLTTGTSMSDINMIHPWAEETLKLWIDWKYPDVNRGIYERRSWRKDYYDSKAALYGALHGMGPDDYMKIVRENNILTYKT